MNIRSKQKGVKNAKPCGRAEYGPVIKAIVRTHLVPLMSDALKSQRL